MAKGSTGYLGVQIAPRVLKPVGIRHRHNVEVEGADIASHLRVHIVQGDQLVDEVEGSVDRSPLPRVHTA